MRPWQWISFNTTPGVYPPMTDKFEQLEAYYEDLSDNGKWLINEIRRLRSEQEAFINEQARLNKIFNTVYDKLSTVAGSNSIHLTDVVDDMIDELTQLRAKEAAPLSDYDRVGKILENVSEKVYDKQARTDIVWLTQEIGKLRGLVKWINRRFNVDLWVPDADSGNTRLIVDRAAHHLRGRASELAKIHDILAEALGYEKAPTAEEDPNCPCPGDYITGDHTSETLAMQAARKIKELQQENGTLASERNRLLDRIHEAYFDRWGD